MKFTFFTNFINHHQAPLADEMYNILKDDYKLVSFEPMPEEFQRRGYPDFSDRPYHIKGYLSENIELVEKLCVNSDILLHAACSESWVTKRLILNKPTIRYGERLFKKIDRRFIKPSFWKSMYDYHTRYRNYPLYMLGASAYNRLDTKIIGAYPKKVFRWGYFTSVPDLNIQQSIMNRVTDCVKILWCGTIIQVKRPDLVPPLAARLNQAAINFHIDMIGSGAWEDQTKEQINRLGVNDRITFMGNMPNNRVRQEMLNHDIFIFTSDYGEGWGCVLNEAMSSGCAVVTSDKAGASRFLVSNGDNGLLFHSGDLDDLFKQVMRYINDINFRHKCAINAYDTLKNEWSPKSAAKRLITLSERILNNQNLDSVFNSGPCSRAKLLL